MKTTYRRGAIGALMDEYERAARELKRLVEQIPMTDFERIADSETKDDDCRSVQSIMSHVVSAGYGYADYIKEQFSMPSTRPPDKLLARQEVFERFDEMLEYTAATLGGKWGTEYGGDQRDRRPHSKWSRLQPGAVAAACDRPSFGTPPAD